MNLMNALAYLGILIAACMVLLSIIVRSLILAIPSLMVIGFFIYYLHLQRVRAPRGKQDE